MMRARGEEDDAAVLARARLGETEDIAIEVTGGLEITDEERNVSQLADFHEPLVYHCLVMAESRPAVLSETAAPPLLLRAAGRVRANARLIGLLALGHLIVDVNQGSLSAVLPFVKSAHGLSYAQVGILVLMANVTSSI